MLRSKLLAAAYPQLECSALLSATLNPAPPPVWLLPTLERAVGVKKAMRSSHARLQARTHRRVHSTGTLQNGRGLRSDLLHAPSSPSSQCIVLFAGMVQHPSWLPTSC